MHKEWTAEEIAFIREHKTEMTNEQLSKKLGCSEFQLVYAIKKYRLKRSTKEYDMLIAKLLGKEYHPRHYYMGLFPKQ